MLIRVGTNTVPCSSISVDGVVGEAGAVFDAVDAGLDQAGHGVLAEDVGGDPGTVGVRGIDRGLEHVVGPQRREIADLRSIQSPTSLIQPSPRRASSATAAGSCDSSSSSTAKPAW